MPLLFLFVIVPAVELWLLITIGEQIGLGTTLLLILATGVFGASLARSQGLAILARVQKEMQAGKTPTTELLEGALILVAGGMLLTPGFLTDALGLLLLVPFTRRLFLGLAGKVFAAAARRGRARGTFTSARFGGPQQPSDRPSGGRPFFRPGNPSNPGGAGMFGSTPIKDAEFEVQEDRDPAKLE